MEIVYFTDGSLDPKIADRFGGIFGFIKVLKTSNGMIVDKVIVGRSNPDINLLESMAISSALQDIVNSDHNNIYSIYTDSNYCYDTLKRLYLGMKQQAKLPKLSNKLISARTNSERSIGSAYTQLLSIINQQYRIELNIVKSHCSNIKQQKQWLMNAYGTEITDRESKFICEGNDKVDKLLRVYNDIWYINYIPWVNPF